MKSKIDSTLKSIGILSFLLVFSVYANAQYCTPTYSVKCGSYNMYIQDFSTTGGVANISNINSGCGNTSTSYIYYSAKQHEGIQGTPVGFTIKNGPTYPRGYRIWVDFNGDGDFSDAGENVWVSSGNINGGASVTSSFTIPPDAVPGVTRMRVRCSYYTTTFTECNNQSYGECEDYNFKVLPSCTADFPIHPSDVTECTDVTASFTATTINAQAYQWQVNAGAGWTDLGNDVTYGGVKTKNLQIKNTAVSMQGYQYRLVATNTGEGCSVESDPASLILVPTTQSSVVLAAAPAKEVCLNEEAILYTSFTNGGTNPKYQWLKNGLTIPGETNATLKIKTLDHGDIIQCRFLSSAQCVPPNNSLGIKFDVVTDLIAEVDVDVNYNGGNSYTFIANPTNGGTEPEFYWYVNGKLLPGETGQSFTSTTLAPWDKVTVGMVSSRDCALPRLATSRQATTGVSDISNGAVNLVLAPNPNKGDFTVRANGINTDVVRISISNTVGQIVYTSEADIKNGLLNHDISLGGELVPGIYIMHLNSNGVQQSMKFNVAR